MLKSFIDWDDLNGEEVKKFNHNNHPFYSNNNDNIVENINTP